MIGSLALKTAHDDDAGRIENHEHDGAQQQPMAETLRAMLTLIKH